MRVFYFVSISWPQNVTLVLILSFARLFLFTWWVSLIVFDHDFFRIIIIFISITFVHFLYLSKIPFLLLKLSKEILSMQMCRIWSLWFWCSNVLRESIDFHLQILSLMLLTINCWSIGLCALRSKILSLDFLLHEALTGWSW